MLQQNSKSNLKKAIPTRRNSIMKSKFLSLIVCFALLSGGFPSQLLADDAEMLSLVQDMRKEMSGMQKTIQQQNSKIDQLSSQRGNSPAAVTETAPASAPMSDYEFNTMLDTATGGAQKWLKDLKFSGDLRLRYEAFSYKSGHPSETDDRNRFRYRLRFGWEKKFNEDMMIGFGLASGENTGATGLGDPTSTNTTFDNNFAFKQINVEKAYASYTPSFAKNIGPIKQTNITAGKMNNPFEKGSSDMVWDRDVKPEGVSEKIDLALLDTENFDLTSYFTAGQYVLDEDATVGGDANLFGYQLGINPTFYVPGLDRPVDFLNAVSYYDYSGYARSSNFFVGTTSLARGNTNVDPITTELDASAFRVFEYYAELGLVIIDVPTKFFFDFARNPSDGADIGVLHDSNAYAFGLKLGSIVKKGDWELLYQYKRIGANSVVGAFNDSDFGDGHSGKRGSVFKAAYALSNNISLNGAAFFVNNLNTGTASILDQEQRRFQMDLVWKF